jgi:rare lipoprotein A
MHVLVTIEEVCMYLKLQKGVVLSSIIFFCLAQLSGCSVNHTNGLHHDGPPRYDFDASKIPDAVPKVEPRSPHGNKSYTIGHHRYVVLHSARGYHTRGTASWYGASFHGKYTSTRERYSLYKMTAASPTLPLPSYVMVTNLGNGRHVILKVNDRGPFRCHRILDVSYAAAKKLGFSGDGTAHVDVRTIDPKRWAADHSVANDQKFAQNQYDKKQQA